MTTSDNRDDRNAARTGDVARTTDADGGDSEGLPGDSEGLPGDSEGLPDDSVGLPDSEGLPEASDDAEQAPIEPEVGVNADDADAVRESVSNKAGQLQPVPTPAAPSIAPVNNGADAKSRNHRRWAFWRWKLWRFWRWRFWWKTRRQHLSKEQMASALALHSPGLVAEIHAISLRAIQAEDQRESRLDAKAQSLLTTATLTLTVAFGVGGTVLLGNQEYLKHLKKSDSVVAIACLVGFGLALLFGLLASVFAVAALRVSDRYRQVSESDVFNRVELADADNECADPTAKSDNEKAVAMYQRYMASAYWRIWQQHYEVHERKASRIRIGQNLLVAFLGTQDSARPILDSADTEIAEPAAGSPLAAGSAITTYRR